MLTAIIAMGAFRSGIPPRLLSRQKLLALCGTGSAGPLRDCALRQSRNSPNACPKRGDRLLDHESPVRQIRHNPLDNNECREAEDRKPPGVSHHYVILARKSFIPGDIEKELHESSEQRRATVVDILSGALRRSRATILLGGDDEGLGAGDSVRVGVSGGVAIAPGGQ